MQAEGRRFDSAQLHQYLTRAVRRGESPARVFDKRGSGKTGKVEDERRRVSEAHRAMRMRKDERVYGGCLGIRRRGRA